MLQHFATGRSAVFLTGANRGELGELAVLSDRVRAAVPGGLRDLTTRPYASWDDALEDLAARAAHEPVLLVLDEFPELVASSPHLPGTLRAFLDRSADHTKLRLLICGSAVRHMRALQEERAPLYGRFDLALQLQPFGPHEAALMLPELTPQDRALVYGVVGGMPMYLSWWDQGQPVMTNLRRLVCEPGARLLIEGDLVLRTDLEGDYAMQILHAIASGRTQYGEIKDYVKSEPQRVLERLAELQLIERVMPVGDSERSKRRSYRIIDPFIRFHLQTVSPFRAEIERGLGATILPVLRQALDDHMGGIWEEAFRNEIRRQATAGTLGTEDSIVAVGAWWDNTGHNEIDAVVLAGRSAVPVLAGEAKWARTANAAALVNDLRRKVEQGLKIDPDAVRYAVCARSSLTHVGPDVLALTADDLFGVHQ